MSSIRRHTIDGPAVSPLADSKYQNIRHNAPYTTKSAVTGINNSNLLNEQLCMPAFLNTENDTVRISRYQNGKPAPIHISTFLPQSWLIDKRVGSRVPRIKDAVIPGFIIYGKFYSRSQALELNKEIIKSIDV